ncbi:MAG: hypothetical protein ABI768_08000 [Acidobacteriota bacterium]
MLTRRLQSVLLAASLGLVAVPAPAQVHVDLPGVEIRIGHSAPPPVRRERRNRRPGGDYVWLAGAWDWQGNDWTWVPGRWERRAYRNARWVAPRYRREGRAWRVEPGHWAGQRVVEGEEYRRWHSEHGGRDHRDNNGRGQGQDKRSDHDRR